MLHCNWSRAAAPPPARSPSAAAPATLQPPGGHHTHNGMAGQGLARSKHNSVSLLRCIARRHTINLPQAGLQRGAVRVRRRLAHSHQPQRALGHQPGFGRGWVGARVCARRRGWVAYDRQRAAQRPAPTCPPATALALPTRAHTLGSPPETKARYCHPRLGLLPAITHPPRCLGAAAPGCTCYCCCRPCTAAAAGTRVGEGRVSLAGGGGCDRCIAPT